MHAMTVEVDVRDPEKGRQRLQEDVIPRLASAPGFIAGYWLAPQDGRGCSLVVFVSVGEARAVAEQARQSGIDEVTIVDVQVREVIVHAYSTSAP